MEVFVSDVDGVVMLERIRSLSAVQTSSKGLSVVSGIYWQPEAKLKARTVQRCGWIQSLPASCDLSKAFLTFMSTTKRLFCL